MPEKKVSGRLSGSTSHLQSVRIATLESLLAQGMDGYITRATCPSDSGHSINLYATSRRKTPSSDHPYIYTDKVKQLFYAKILLTGDHSIKASYVFFHSGKPLKSPVDLDVSVDEWIS